MAFSIKVPGSSHVTERSTFMIGDVCAGRHFCSATKEVERVKK